MKLNAMQQDPFGGLETSEASTSERRFFLCVCVVVRDDCAADLTAEDGIIRSPGATINYRTKQRKQA